MPCPYLEGLNEDEQDAKRDSTADDAGAQACPPQDNAPASHATAQNEANSSQPLADDEQAESYDGAACNIDLAALMKLAAGEAAQHMRNRRRKLKSA